MQSAVSEVTALLSRLPEGSEIEDIQYHLYIIAKVQQALAQAAAGGVVSHEDVEKQFEQWLGD